MLLLILQMKISTFPQKDLHLMVEVQWGQSSTKEVIGNLRSWACNCRAEYSGGKCSRFSCPNGCWAATSTKATNQKKRTGGFSNFESSNYSRMYCFEPFVQVSHQTFPSKLSILNKTWSMESNNEVVLCIVSDCSHKHVGISICCCCLPFLFHIVAHILPYVTPTKKFLSSHLSKVLAKDATNVDIALPVEYAAVPRACVDPNWYCLVIQKSVI